MQSLIEFVQIAIVITNTDTHASHQTSRFQNVQHATRVKSVIAMRWTATDYRRNVPSQDCVLPNPPSPRSVVGSASTTLTSGVTIGSITSCAMRAPRSTPNASVE